MLHKQIIKPIWTYGLALWGCAAKFDREVMQRRKNIILRVIVDANRSDLRLLFINGVIKEFAKSHKQRLQSHINADARQPLDNTGCRMRRLIRHHSLDLVV